MGAFRMARAFLLALPLAAGHSFLQKPQSRNLWRHFNGDPGSREYCPHCGQGGGPSTVKSRGNGVWPTIEAPGSHGLCGDPFQNTPVRSLAMETYLVPTPIQETYTAGSIVEFQIGVSTHHRGHYEFRICDRALDRTLASYQDGQDCLNQWVLERAPLKASCQGYTDADCQPIDQKHPGRWYLPPAGHNTQQAGPDWRDEYADLHESVMEVHKMRYKIPEGLSCSHCTLQWYWSTGNTCVYDGGYFEYFANMSRDGWPATSWCTYCAQSSCEQSCCKTNGKFGEEFWNCADIAVLASGPAPPPSPTPSPGPQPQPETLAPTPAPPTPPPESCQSVWQQCGGVHYTGPTCCEVGSYCWHQSEWYSQCKPGSGPTQAPSTTEMPTEQPTERPTEPPTTTAAPQQPTCLDFCGLTNVTASYCSVNSHHEAACRKSYIVKGSEAIPCSWFASCGCIADGEKLLSCPDLSTQCSALLLEETRTINRHGHLRSPYPQKTAGMAFVTATQKRERNYHTEAFPEL